MKVSKLDGRREREALTGLIVSDAVAGALASRWQPNSFPSKWSNLIAGWCVDFYKKHHKAPGRAVQSLYADWAEQNGDPDAGRLVSRFLEALSDDWESHADGLNADHLIDQTGKLVLETRLRALRDEIDARLEAGQADKAKAAVTGFSAADLSGPGGTNLLNSEETVMAVFNQERSEVLVEYPDALGLFFGDSFARNSFVAFSGPEKSGKSMNLLDLAVMAVEQRRKVAWFDVGDMTEDQVAERFLVRLARRPTTTDTGTWPVTVRKPLSIAPPAAPGEAPRVEFKELKFKRPLGFKDAWAACCDFMEKKVRSKKSHLRLSCHPNSSVSVSDIRGILSSWALGGWAPDVVIIDYADILAPVDRKAERRDQINDSWKAMRALSQELHILVATASQTNRESYRARTIRMEHAGEDKRKWGHVTAAWGISASEEEEDLQVRRLNWVVRRRGRKRFRTVFTAGCPDFYMPCVRACLPGGGPGVAEVGSGNTESEKPPVRSARTNR